jgi:hypothetical protein
MEEDRNLRFKHFCRILTEAQEESVHSHTVHTEKHRRYDVRDYHDHNNRNYIVIQAGIINSS